MMLLLFDSVSSGIFRQSRPRIMRPVGRSERVGRRRGRLWKRRNAPATNEAELADSRCDHERRRQAKHHSRLHRVAIHGASADADGPGFPEGKSHGNLSRCGQSNRWRKWFFYKLEEVSFLDCLLSILSWFLSQSINQSIIWRINQSVNQSINGPTSQSISRSINQSIDQSIPWWKQILKQFKHIEFSFRLQVVH